MEHQLSVIVTKELITIANRRFWIQFVGWGGLIRWVLVSVVVFSLCVLARQAWAYGLIVLAVCIPLIWVGGYLTFLRRAFYRYDQMQSKLLSYRFTEQGLESASDLGRAEVPWRMMEKVQRYPDVWLLFFGSRAYVYLPVAEMTEPLKEYIRQQAEKHGIKSHLMSGRREPATRL